MINRQQVWGLLPFRAFIIDPLGDLGVDLSKLYLLETPYTWIAWHYLLWTIRFNFSVYCYSDGIMAPSLLSFWTSSIAVALTFYQMVDKFCVFCFCYCCCYLVIVFSFSVVVRLVVFSLNCFVALIIGFVTLIIGSRSMTYVILSFLSPSL